MPEKPWSKLFWIVMNAVLTLTAGFLLLSFTALGDKWIRTEKDIDNKADKEYVDQMDNEIKAGFDFYRVSHEQAHSKEYRAIQDQLDLIQKSSDQQIELLVRLINERE